MTAPRIYLMGACASLPDLGVGWRKIAAEAVVAAGGIPVYPPDILPVARGILPAEDARAAWVCASREDATEERLRCLRVLSRCDASLCLLDGRQGAGTQAELAFAAWLPGRHPITYAQDEDALPAKAAEAVAKAKETMNAAR
jgi:hypothetical protein